MVVVLSAIPGFGAFAYLAAKPGRQSRLLVRAAVDQLMVKVPGRLYERSGARRLIAKPALDRGGVAEVRTDGRGLELAA